MIASIISIKSNGGFKMIRWFSSGPWVMRDLRETPRLDLEIRLLKTKSIAPQRMDQGQERCFACTVIAHKQRERCQAGCLPAAKAPVVFKGNPVHDSAFTGERILGNAQQAAYRATSISEKAERTFRVASMFVSDEPCWWLWEAPSRPCLAKVRLIQNASVGIREFFALNSRINRASRLID